MAKGFIYLLTHTWDLGNGDCGIYEQSFSDIDEAFARFLYLKLLIENDSYDFNVHFTPYAEGDMTFSAYEDVDSYVNRQDLIIKQVEVSL